MLLQRLSRSIQRDGQQAETGRNRMRDISSTGMCFVFSNVVHIANKLSAMAEHILDAALRLFQLVYGNIYWTCWLRVESARRANFNHRLKWRSFLALLYKLVAAVSLPHHEITDCNGLSTASATGVESFWCTGNRSFKRSHAGRVNSCLSVNPGPQSATRHASNFRNASSRRRSLLSRGAQQALPPRCPNRGSTDCEPFWYHPTNLKPRFFDLGVLQFMHLNSLPCESGVVDPRRHTRRPQVHLKVAGATMVCAAS